MFWTLNNLALVETVLLNAVYAYLGGLKGASAALQNGMEEEIIKADLKKR